MLHLHPARAELRARRRWTSSGSPGRRSKSMRASLRAANIQAQFSFVIALVEALSICGGRSGSGSGWSTASRSPWARWSCSCCSLQNMFKPARKIVSEWYKVGKVFASVERIDDLLDRELAVTDAPDAVPAPPFEGRLALQHVTLRLPGRARGRVAGRQPATGAARHRLRGGARGGGRPRRPQRGGQEHDRAAGPTAVRPRQGTGAGRRTRRARRHPRVAAAAGQPGAAGDRAAERHGRREHRLRDRRTPRPRTSRRPPGWPTPTSSSRRCPTGTTPPSASAARRCPADSVSASPSPGPSSDGHRS